MVHTRKPLTGNELAIENQNLPRRRTDCEGCGATPDQNHTDDCLATIEGRARAAKRAKQQEDEI